MNRRLFWLIPGLVIVAGVVWMFLPSGNLHHARSFHGAVLLPSGQVLVIGGTYTPSPMLDSDGPTATWLINHGCDWLSFLWVVRSQSLKSCELFDPQTHLWSPAESLHRERDFSSPVLMPNGAVLESGGRQEVAEFYQSGRWTETGAWPLSVPQIFQTVLLPNGDVLAVGNYRALGPDDHLLPVPCFLYHPETSTWTTTQSAKAVVGDFALTVLGNGKVLAAGGDTSDEAAKSGCELYDPPSGTWTEMPDLSQPRSNFNLVTLNDGTALAVGGFAFGGGLLRDCDLFDPKTRSWKKTGDLTYARANGGAARLQNGQVLVIGGGEGAGDSTCELYDPETGGWSSTGQLREPRFGFTTTLLQDGQVLVTAGYHGEIGLTSCEIYNPKTGVWTQN